MDQIAAEKHSIKSVKVSLSDFGSVDQRDGVQFATFFRKSISKKSGNQFSSEYDQEAKALRGG